MLLISKRLWSSFGRGSIGMAENSIAIAIDVMHWSLAWVVNSMALSTGLLGDCVDGLDYQAR